MIIPLNGNCVTLYVGPLHGMRHEFGDNDNLTPSEESGQIWIAVSDPKNIVDFHWYCKMGGSNRFEYEFTDSFDECVLEGLWSLRVIHTIRLGMGWGV